MSGRTALLLLALGVFLYFAWKRRNAERDKWRLRSVPMPEGVTVSEFTGANTPPVGGAVGGPACGCA